jgi:5,10-methylenetetrahydromethanopterin reductase
MGLGAIRVADLEIYVRTVLALWRGETVDMEIEGKRRAVRLLNPELGLINTRDPIGLYVAATGARARDLTARLRAGWIDNAANLQRGLAAVADMRNVWSGTGNDERALDAVAWTGGVVLESGEAADSPRALAQAGPRAATLLHRAADEALMGSRNAISIPAGFEDLVAGYVALARTFEPKGAHYLENHRGHLMFLKPEERPFITAELIRHTTFTGTAKELAPRIEQLEAAGFRQIVFSILPGQEHSIEDWGRLRRAFA